MRALLGPQVLAAEVPADVHELDRVERAAAPPGGRAGVRALALERVLDRHHAGRVARPPRDAEIVADVREEDDVNALEVAVAHEVGLGPEQLLGHPRPELDRAREPGAAP